MKIKEKLIRAMEEYFGNDQKRISHAHRVTKFAEEILIEEKGDAGVVIAAGVLHDIGIHQAEKKYGSSSGKYQEIEGPPIARDIMVKLGFNSEKINQVCDIIAHHHSPGKINTVNFDILYDADWLVNLGDECDLENKEKLKRTIEKVFLTPTGKKMAYKIYG